MASINQAIIIGNLGQEPKIAESKNDKKRKIVSFSVATTDKGYIKSDGTKIEDSTEWHNIVLFGSLAEIAAKYLHKGSLVYIQGKLKTRSYEDKTGQKRHITEIIGEVMQMLSKQEKISDIGSQPISEPDDNAELKGKSIVQLFNNRNGAGNDEELPF